MSIARQNNRQFCFFQSSHGGRGSLAPEEAAEGGKKPSEGVANTKPDTVVQPGSQELDFIFCVVLLT